MESAEQTEKGVRYKRPKSGRSRTVALSMFVVNELRVHRLRQAEELLRLGARQNEATFGYTREDGEPMQPRSLTHAWNRMLARTSLPRIRFHDLRHARTFSLLECIQKLPASAWAIPRLGLPLTYIPMSCPACKPMPQPALTMPYKWRYRSGLVEHWVAIR